MRIAKLIKILPLVVKNRQDSFFVQSVSSESIDGFSGESDQGSVLDSFSGFSETFFGSGEDLSGDSGGVDLRGDFRGMVFKKSVYFYV
jgi:hypothetical protein